MNAVDRFLIFIADKLCPLFYFLGFTANNITSLSLVAGILFNYAYFCKRYVLASIMLVISYFFDCMDGHFARKYDMQTSFGDYYDHIKDILVMVLFFLLLMYHSGIPYLYKIVGLSVAFFLSLYAFMEAGCPSQYSSVNNFFKPFRALCSMTQKFRLPEYFGCVSYNAFIILFVLGHSLF